MSAEHETVPFVTPPPGGGADAVDDLVAAVDGVALSGGMAAWLQQLAGVFADWHELVVEALEHHPALDPDACWERPSVVPPGYRRHIVQLVHGIGSGDAAEVGPLSTALLELAGRFGRTFEPLRAQDRAAFGRIHASSVLIPPPLGASTGLTARFVTGVHEVLDSVTGPGLGADEIRRRVLEHKGRGFAALDRLHLAATSQVAIAS